jgi:hypothetical protein
MASEITLPSAASHAEHIGQSTSVEQARAAAEVQALVIVAQNCPRNVERAVGVMEDSCRQESFAEQAFYDFVRGKDDQGKPKRIFDITIVAAKEIARCWGNIQYSLTELRQDRVRHESEILTWAWDMEGNHRVERKIIVPHVRNSNYGDKVLTDVRDVYELLANNAARRLRECIKDVLPPWYVDRARKTLLATLEHGGGVPLAERRAIAVSLFADKHGVTQQQLEARLERPSSQWTVLDLAKLSTVNSALNQGRSTVADEFPPERIRAADLTAAPERPTPSPAQAPAQSAHLFSALTSQLLTLGYGGDLGHPTLLTDVALLAGRDQLDSLNVLTDDELTAVVDHLNRVLQDDYPGHALDALLAHLSDTRKADPGHE